MVYLDGNLFIVVPSLAHGRLTHRLGLFVMTVVEELDVPCIVSGRTTFRRLSTREGVEGDQTYYLENVARIRGKRDIDLEVDPPPDLAVEVPWTYKAEQAIEVYRRFRVPEVWVCDDRKLTILVLQPSGDYEPSESSRALPVLAAEIHEWATRRIEDDDTAWGKALRRWIRENVAPRLRTPPSKLN
jgi:Uma2 family endonuclease